ncbi:uncharacterized protein LOC135368269 [Ornithodoros turicata]|uniref:uncharacterized protein LOC135368269 n=1 Tax=Ornithodoros turicata TaxID=34597 RepID=UPI0031395E2B
MWNLAPLTCLVTSVLETAASLLNAFFRFNYLIGSGITTCATTLCGYASDAISGIYLGITYAFGDLFHFLRELCTLIFSFSDGVQAIACAVVNSVFLACSGTQSALVFLWTIACNVIDAIADGAVAAILLARHLVNLLLDSALLLLELPPRLLRQVCQWTYHGICVSYQTLASSAKAVSGLTAATTLQILRDLWRFLFHQPVDVYTGLIFVAISAFLFKLWRRCGRSWMQKVRGRRRDSQAMKRHKPSSQAEPHDLCVVCQDSPRGVLLLPCRHFSLCEECASHLLEFGHSCPICRHPIYEALTVYT